MGADPSITQTDEGTAPSRSNRAKPPSEAERPVSSVPSLLENAGVKEGGVSASSSQRRSRAGRQHQRRWEFSPTDEQFQAAFDASKKVFGFATYPGVQSSEPAKVMIGGLNLAVAKTSQHKAEAFEAIPVHAQRGEPKRTLDRGGGLPAVRRGRSTTILAFQAKYPQYEIIRQQLTNAAVRPARPSTRQCRHASRRRWRRSPTSTPSMRRRARRPGTEGHRREGADPVTASVAEQAAPGRRHRRQSFGPTAGVLAGGDPAVILMIAVTAYPIAYAVWLSLQR